MRSGGSTRSTYRASRALWAGSTRRNSATFPRSVRGEAEQADLELGLCARPSCARWCTGHSDSHEVADSSVDFSGYQVIYVVAAKGTGVERSPAFHDRPGSGIAVDGSELRYGATFFEDTKDDPKYAANVLIHETGHVLGLPDLYDVRHPRYWSLFGFAGGWDTMSWNDPGFHFLAWQKWKLGWLAPSQLACLDSPGEVTATVTPIERNGGLKAIALQTTASTALVIEARRRIGQDRRLCAEGVLIYSVDATVRSGYGPVRVHAAQPDRTFDLHNRCGPRYNAPFAHASGAVDHFEDADAGVSMQILSSSEKGYRVRVTRARDGTSEAAWGQSVVNLKNVITT